MKKFFKALAVVLALTLVIGTIPASAAVSLELKGDGTKIIYIDGSNGTKVADGTKCVVTNKYKLSKLVKNFDPATMDIKLKSADKTVATTSNNYDRVYAKGIGTTDVTITVVDLESEDQSKVLATLTEKVVVKKNATEDNFVVVSEDIVDGAKVGVNTAYQVRLPRVQDGVKVDTDKRRIVCEDESVVIEAANKANTLFNVTFTKAGEFTLSAEAYQSNLFDGTTVAQTIKVTAGFEAESVKQVALNKAEVTFDCNVSGLDKSNFSAYYMIGDVKVPFSSVKEVKCADNTATVEFYTNFTQGTEFFVEYDAKTAGSFTAIKVDANSVAAISIPAQEVTAGTLSNIKYALLDENGIDITSLFGSTLNGTIAFTLVDAATDAFATGSQVYITKVGESYTLTGKYTWYVDGNPKNVEGAGVVTSVAAPVKTLTALTGIITAETANVDGDASKAAKVWANGDVLNLQVGFKYMTGSTETKETLATQDYIAVVADESIVMLGAKDGYKYPLIANKEGSTTILIYSPADANGNRTVLGAVPVTVKAARKAAAFTVTADKNNINAGYEADQIKFTTTLLDQYEEKMTGTVTIEQVAGDKVATFAKTTAAVGEKVVKSTDITWIADGAITLKFSCGDFSQTVGVSVAKDAIAVVQTLKVSGTALETGVKADTEAKTITVSLAGQTKNGYAAAGESISFTDKAPVSSASTGSATKYVYTVAKDGKLIEKQDGINFAGNTFTSVVAASDGAINASGAATKLAAGNYVVTAYKVAENGTASIVSVVGTATFVVTDNQIKPEFKQNVEKVVDLKNPTEAFSFKFDGKDVAASAWDIQVDGAGTTAYVKSATIVIDTKVGTQSFNVAIGALINK